MTAYEEEQVRCDCCGLMRRYLDLKCVRLELPVRRVGRFTIAARTIVYRMECRDCREDDNG